MVDELRLGAHAPMKMGWIPYANLLPLKHEVERLFGAEVELHKGHPAVVNRWLVEGKIALAPCSSVCLVKNSQLDILLPVGIASQGNVSSVYLGLYHEEAGLLELIRQRQGMLREVVKQGQLRYGSDVRKLASFIFKMAATLPPVDLALTPGLSVTPASATSTQLARILYKLWFGETAYDMRAAPGSSANSVAMTTRRPMELLIGDEALARRPQFRAVIDLGEAWREATDLPFVFAVWQTSRRGLSPIWRQKLAQAVDIAQARMRVEPSYYYPDPLQSDVNGRPIDLGSYWRCIQYRLTPQHFKGLALFLSLTRCLQPDLIDDQAVVNITRWESLGQASAMQL